MPCFRLVSIKSYNNSLTIDLHDEHSPYPLPEFETDYQAVIVPHRRGNDGPGLPAVQLGGSQRSGSVLRFSCPLLDRAQVDAIQSLLWLNPPQPIQITIDGGLTWFWGSFLPDGFRPKAHTTGPDQISAEFAIQLLREVTP